MSKQLRSMFSGAQVHVCLGVRLWMLEQARLKSSKCISLCGGGGMRSSGPCKNVFIWLSIFHDLENSVYKFPRLLNLLQHLFYCVVLEILDFSL